MNYLRIIGGRAPCRGNWRFREQKQRASDFGSDVAQSGGKAYSIAARACRMWTLRSAFCAVWAAVRSGRGHAVCTYRRHGLR